MNFLGIRSDKELEDNKKTENKAKCSVAQHTQSGSPAKRDLVMSVTCGK
jgi:hypothetical protein